MNVAARAKQISHITSNRAPELGPRPVPNKILQSERIDTTETQNRFEEEKTVTELSIEETAIQKQGANKYFGNAQEVKHVSMRSAATTPCRPRVVIPKVSGKALDKGYPAIGSPRKRVMAFPLKFNARFMENAKHGSDLTTTAQSIFTNDAMTSLLSNTLLASKGKLIDTDLSVPQTTRARDNKFLKLSAVFSPAHATHAGKGRVVHTRNASRSSATNSVLGIWNKENAKDARHKSKKTIPALVKSLTNGITLCGNTISGASTKTCNTRVHTPRKNSKEVVINLEDVNPYNERVQDGGINIDGDTIRSACEMFTKRRQSANPSMEVKQRVVSRAGDNVLYLYINK